jgi:hypothetical protein
MAHEPQQMSWNMIDIDENYLKGDSVPKDLSLPWISYRMISGQAEWSYLFYERIISRLRVQRSKIAHYSRRITRVQTPSSRTSCNSTPGPKQSIKKKKIAHITHTQEDLTVKLRYRCIDALQKDLGRTVARLVCTGYRVEIETGFVEGKTGWKSRWKIGIGRCGGGLRGGHPAQQGKDQAAKSDKLGQASKHPTKTQQQRGKGSQQQRGKGSQQQSNKTFKIV